MRTDGGDAVGERILLGLLLGKGFDQGDRHFGFGDHHTRAAIDVLLGVHQLRQEDLAQLLFRAVLEVYPEVNRHLRPYIIAQLLWNTIQTF